MAEAAIESRDEADFSEADGWLARTARVSQVLYWGVHLASLLVFVVGVSTGDLWLLAGTLFVRMFFLTAGYHRYFAHRTFKTGRVFQFVLAFCGASAVQKGPLWWAGNHRIHHRETDRPGDPHSPKEGFWHAHQGWIFAERFGPTPLDTIRDFARYPEIEWLNRWHAVPAILLGALCVAVGGFSGFVWGFCVSTTLLWHFTYAVNSFAHRFGTRRYQTGDLSRNNWWVALLTLGEGWHNNHHYYMASVRQGFRWWEIDVTYYVLRGLASLGVIWDLREPPASVVAGESALPRAA